MKCKKNDEFNCVADTANFYGAIIISVFMLYVALISIIIMITEDEKQFTVPAICISVLFSVVSLIVALHSSRTKFTINRNTCQICTKKRIVLSCSTESIKRIVVLRYGISMRYIVLDCEEYPYLTPIEYTFFNNHFVLRYSRKKLKNIQKYCPNAFVYNDDRINYLK